MGNVLSLTDRYWNIVTTTTVVLLCACMEALFQRVREWLAEKEISLTSQLDKKCDNHIEYFVDTCHQKNDLNSRRLIQEPWTESSHEKMRQPRAMHP
jgi:hypothetical protein